MTTASLSVPYLSKAEIETKADDLRLSSFETQTPIDPVKICRKRGIDVRTATFSEEDISGLIRRFGSGYQILVNNSHAYVRQRYTIAHELGHYCLHKDLFDDEELVDRLVDFYRHGPDSSEPSKHRAEIQANLFAASLLMPATLVKEAFDLTRNPKRLAEIFAVSETAMNFRVAALDL